MQQNIFKSLFSPNEKVNKVSDTDDIIRSLFMPKDYTTTSESTNPEIINVGNDNLTNENLVITTQDLLSLTFFTTGVRIISNGIAKVRLVEQTRQQSDTEWKTLYNSQLDILLNRRPNQAMTQYDFKKQIVWNLFLYGNAPVYVVWEEIQGMRLPVELIPIFPSWIRRKYNAAIRDYDYYLNTTETELISGGYLNNVIEKKNKEIKLDSDAVIYFNYENVNGLSDSNFKTMSKAAINKLKENETSMINSIRNEIGIGFIVKTGSVTDAAKRKEIRETFHEMLKFYKHTGSTIFVSDPKSEITTAKDTLGGKVDFETRNAVGREFASALGIPAYMLGIKDDNKYNSHVEQTKQFNDTALAPILLNITNELTKFFFLTEITKRITYKRNDLIALDPITAKDFCSTAINNGFMSPNEGREIIGLDPVPEGYGLLINSALIPLKNTIDKSKLDLQLLKNQVEKANEPPPTPTPIQQVEEPNNNDVEEQKEPDKETIENNEKSLENKDSNK